VLGDVLRFRQVLVDEQEHFLRLQGDGWRRQEKKGSENDRSRHGDIRSGNEEEANGKFTVSPGAIRESSPFEAEKGSIPRLVHTITESISPIGRF